MESSAGGLSGLLPSQAPNTVLNYQLEIAFSNGSTSTYPLNQQDPWYEVYFGEVTPIYCTTFTGDAANEWTMTGTGGTVGWNIGTPTGAGGDPNGGFDDNFAMGTNLEGSYTPGYNGVATSPDIGRAPRRERV